MDDWYVSSASYAFIIDLSDLSALYFKFILLYSSKEIWVEGFKLIELFNELLWVDGFKFFDSFREE